MNKKAFIFDMDGVIIDSEPIHARAKLAVLEEYGVKLADPKAELEAFVGRSAKDFWQTMKARYSHILKPEWHVMADRKYEIYMDILANDKTLKPIEGVVDLLQRLQDKGYHIALGTSSVRTMAETVLKQLEVIDFFEEIATSDEVEKAKPAPDIYLKAAEKLGLKPEDCNVVEDAAAGVRAAKAAGMYCIAIVNPSSGAQDLSPADEIVKKYADIKLENAV